MMEQEKMKVEYISVDKLKPYERNARKHTDDDVQYIENSIREFGFNDPIGIWGEQNLIVEGHGRLLAAQNLGMTEVPCIRLDYLTDEQRRAYALAHNRTAELSAWDETLKEIELSDITDIDMSKLGFDEEDENGLSSDYSDNIGSVIYEPKQTSHKESELYYQTDIYDEMIESLQNENIKEMLRIRAHWFCDFNFEKIADYYAYQATEQEQRVFEALGLVLLDRDKLIENGFANLMETVDTEDDYE